MRRLMKIGITITIGEGQVLSIGKFGQNWASLGGSGEIFGVYFGRVLGFAVRRVLWRVIFTRLGELG